MAFGNRLAATGLGALGGAGTGSAFGPVGATGGALLGGLGGYLGSGDAQPMQQRGQAGNGIPGVTGAQFQQTSRFSPQVQSALEQRLMQGLGQQNDFAPIAEQARQQFQQRTIPSIAERFTSMGGGAQRSSAFPAALGDAGVGLESNLAALQSQHGMQQQQLLNQLLAQAPYETTYQPEEISPLMRLLAPLLMGLGGSTPDIIKTLSQFRSQDDQPRNNVGKDSTPSGGNSPEGFSPSATQNLTGEQLVASQPNQVPIQPTPLINKKLNQLSQRLSNPANQNLPWLNRLFQGV